MKEKQDGQGSHKGLDGKEVQAPDGSRNTDFAFETDSIGIKKVDRSAREELFTIRNNKWLVLAEHSLRI